MNDDAPWVQDVTHGWIETGDEVTFKENADQSEILVARGHVEDIQRDIDHVHAWDQKGDHPDHHDMRFTDPLFPDSPS